MIRRVLSMVLLGSVMARLALAAEGAPEHLVPERLYDARTVLAQVASESPEPTLTPEPAESNSRIAMLYSLILPGLGEYTLGHHERAAVFFVAEGAIWTSYAVFRVEGSHRKTIYEEFAAVHAGVPKRNDDEFYRIISNYVGADGPFSANEQVRREARAYYPDDRAQQEAYFQEHAYTGNDSWQWDSDATFARYQDMRDASIASYHNSQFSVGLLVANRLISVVDTGILCARKKREVTPSTGFRWNIEADPAGARLLVSRTF